MKPILLALVAAAGLTATAAHAGTINIGSTIHIGSGPGYSAPGYGRGHHAPPAYCPPPAPRGYWKDVTVSVWVPGRWVVSRDHCGRRISVWQPPHREYRTDRVWVDGYASYDHHPRRHSRRWNG